MFVKVTGDKYDDKDPNAYDQDHFYCLETGREHMQTRTSELVNRSVAALVEDKRFVHYTTKADFIRDAIVHRLHYWIHEIKDPTVRAQVEQDLRDHNRKMFWIKRKIELAEMESEYEAVVKTMRTRIAKQQKLQPLEEQNVHEFLDRFADLLNPDQFTAVYMLRLWFMTSPTDLFASGEINEDEPWVIDHLRDWMRRNAFWDTHPDPMTAEFTRDDAYRLDMDEIQRRVSSGEEHLTRS